MPHIESTQQSLARIKRLGESPRYRHLTRLEAVWKGLRYEQEGRPSFWDKEVPLAERAPCVVYPIARSAGQRLCSLVFGEQSFPKVNADPTMRLTPEQARVFGRLLSAIVKQTHLAMRMREAMEQGLMTGTVVVHVSLRRGRLCIDFHPAKWCTPKFNPRTGDLEELEIRYRYESDGQHFWFRRCISAAEDVTYLPAECTDDGTEPEWVADPDKVFPLEMMPCVWFRSMPEPGVHTVDGVALHEGLEDEMEALDFSLSQRHRNARYNGEPVIAQIGVESDAVAGAVGRNADVPTGTPGSWWNRPSATQAAIKKAPGTLWKIPQGGDVKMVESSGAGANILNSDASELRKMILEVMQVVIADADTLGSGELSARALAILMGPMLAVCDNLRVAYGDLLCEVIAKMLRLLATSTAQFDGVALDGHEEALPMLVAFAAADRDFVLDLTWGDYFPPSAAETSSKVDTASKAAGGKPVVSHKTAVRYVAGVLGVDDVDTELAAIEAEASRGTADLTGMLGALGDKPAAPVVAQAEADGVTVPPSTTGDAAVTAEGAGVVPVKEKP